MAVPSILVKYWLYRVQMSRGSKLAKSGILFFHQIFLDYNCTRSNINRFMSNWNCNRLQLLHWQVKCYEKLSKVLDHILVLIDFTSWSTNSFLLVDFIENLWEFSVMYKIRSVFYVRFRFNTYRIRNEQWEQSLSKHNIVDCFRLMYFNGLQQRCIVSK